MAEQEHPSAVVKRRRAAVTAELAAAGPVTVTVRGGCMAPEIPSGARVTVMPAGRYWPGDVVAYGSGGAALVLHRVLGYRRAGGRWCLVTRGDRGSGVDGPVLPEQVVGRLERRVPLSARLVAVIRFAGWALAAVLRRLRP